MPGRLSKWFVVGLILAGVLTGVTVGLVLAVGLDLPQVQGLEDMQHGAATRILSADGIVLAELFIEKRLPLTLEEIPKPLLRAVVAVEDRRFRRHPGLDLIRNLGALIRDIQAGRLAQGGSTITQQLARNLFLTPEKTISRKLKEIFLALQIERRYTKDEILLLYLNQIYLGAGAYGVGAASEIYFNKPVSELTVGECALLAGLPQWPEGYQPFTHPDKALARRRIVLKAMVREDFLTSEEADRLAEEPLRLGPPPTGRVKAPYFVQQVKARLVGLFGENVVYKGGLTVETTLDADMQAVAERAASEGVRRLRKAVGREQFPKPSPGRGWVLEPETPQCALAALNVRTGGVMAWVGGADYVKSSFDRAASAWRRPGSSFIPLVHAAAIESGLTQADRIWDAPIQYSLPDRSEPWRPRNFSGRYEGEITLRRAVEISGNVAAVKLLSRIGLDHFSGLARKFGFTSPLNRDLTLALGASPVSLLELTSAYRTIAGGGLYVTPHFITRVLDRTGRIVFRANPGRWSALSPEAAYIVTDMLKGAVQDGTAQRARVLGRPVAGQAGMTQDRTDALFVGYTPDVAVGVWVGYDSGDPFDQARTAARTALPIWVDFMGEALVGRPPTLFSRPADIVMAPMNRFTGGPGRGGEPGFVFAAFRRGAEPR